MDINKILLKIRKFIKIIKIINKKVTINNLKKNNMIHKLIEIQ